MLILVHCAPPNEAVDVVSTLSLTAAERVRSRHRFTDDQGQALYLNLPRGTVLRGGDLLRSEEGLWVRVLAKPEPVLTVTAAQPLDLLRAAYHLGNRHVALEITPHYLRLEPDSVLAAMLQQMGVQIKAEVAPFEPEAGAYGASHHPSHKADSAQTHAHEHSHSPSAPPPHIHASDAAHL
ncbi:MAG TPA: urease accessory protein UreE [Leptolyngbyaceae cyanobacterium]